MNRCKSIFLFGIIFVFIVLPVGALAQKTLSGTISSDLTLTTFGGRIYRVTGSVTVTGGAVLTINPGVVLKFDSSRSLTISDGRLVAIGKNEPDSLIYFTSIKDDNVPPPGDDTNGDGNSTVPDNHDWQYIRFTDNADDSSILQYCQIHFGGYGSSGNITCENASPTIEDCDIFAAYYGVKCTGVSAPVLRNTAINAMTDCPVAIEITANPVFDNLAFESVSDNGFDALGILGGTLTGSNRISMRGATLGSIPIDNLVYILLDDVTVAPGGNLSIQPGIVVKPKTGTDIIVQGTLTMNGTADPDSHIVFTSFKDDNYGTPNDTNNDGSITAPSQGDWGRIDFQQGSMGYVTYSVIKFGGNNTEGIVRAYNADPFIISNEISDTYFGVELGGTCQSYVLSNNINNCSLTPVLMSVSADPVFAGNTFTNNTITAVGITGEVVGVNSLLKVRTVAGYENITYWLENNLTMSIGARLRIEPGVVLKFRSTRPWITIEGGLKADGTADSMIVFTSQYDDDHGTPADTEGNGTATTPDHGDWRNIRYTMTSDDAYSKLDHCVIAYGGYDGSDNYKGALWCNSASPPITNCYFNSNRTGIRTDGNSAPLIEANDFFNHDYIPLATSVLADPDYVDNTFTQNKYHAVGILSETISQNATLERIEVGGPPQFSEYFPYIHLGTLTVGSGTILTVQPGIVVKNISTVLSIDVNGGLRLQGKADPDSQIVYTSIMDDSYGGDSNVDGSATSPDSDDWSGIRFNSTTIPSEAIVEYCLFRFGGYSPVIDCQSASPTIQNNEFEINRWGIRIQNASNPVISNNLFRLTSRLPLLKSVLANPVFSGNMFDNNSYDALGLIGEDIAQDLTVHKWDIAGFTNITRILVTGELNINLGAKLTIEPGVVIKMGARYPYTVYPQGINVQGGLEAIGTESEPIVFTSILDDEHGNPLDTNNDGSLTWPDNSDWYNIEFDDVSTDHLNRIEYCDFYYGGGGHLGAINIITASPSILNCNFYKNEYYGIRISGDSSPSVDSCLFDYNQRTPIVMSLMSDPAFSGNHFNDTNGFSALGIIGETLAQDALWKRRNVAQTENIPYVLTSNLTAGLSSILRIEPGVVIKPLASTKITVQRGLVAEGKADPESLIVFTSTLDDFYGGDTNNDSTLTDGSGSRWDHIQIDNEAIDDSVRFDYCVFRYAANSTTYGALNVTNANPQIDHCIFSKNGVGINYNGASGDPVKGRVENSDIFDNTYFGIKNTGMSFTVRAQDCWWGDDTGPYDPSDDTGSGGFYNPGGLGDNVTDMVDYSGWRSDGAGNYLLGDVSLNGEIRAFDASLVLQHVALLITLDPLQEVIGDVTCEAGLSALDASYILRYVAGLISYFPCAFNSIETAPRPELLASGPEQEFPGLERGDFEVSLPSFTIDPGGTATFPINVSGSGELLGHEYILCFDPEQVSVSEVRLTDQADRAILAWNAGEKGRVRIAVASAAILPVEAAVEITLRAGDRLIAGEGVPVYFALARLNEDDYTDTAGSVTGNNDHGSLPSVYGLDQNFPNPFNPSTSIRYSIPAGSGALTRVVLKVYDVSGRLVRTLVDEEQAPGIINVTWDGLDNNGKRVVSGVYFYSIEAGRFRDSKKMILMR
ncbi:MAG: T9SS type A sorting domain-containing protein [Candidatus Krumholzibacteriota bacterium]|nr:T9SS type A sorting domain-containing protein [Candidatus Krumholzibacteriota bacterium]